MEGTSSGGLPPGVVVVERGVSVRRGALLRRLAAPGRTAGLGRRAGERCEARRFDRVAEVREDLAHEVGACVPFDEAARLRAR
jgi:hypothetical protein